MSLDTGLSLGVGAPSSACFGTTLSQEAHCSAATSVAVTVTHVICAAVDAAASATANTAAPVTHAAVTNAHATNAVSHQSS